MGIGGIGGEEKTRIHHSPREINAAFVVKAPPPYIFRDRLP